jgi:hypothetical protein
MLGGRRQAQQLAGRSCAVGIDEADEVGIRAGEGLTDHAPLTELGQGQDADAIVLGHVISHDRLGSVRARVQGDDKSDPGIPDLSAVAGQGATDSVFLVVGWKNDVQAHASLHWLGFG